MTEAAATADHDQESTPPASNTRRFKSKGKDEGLWLLSFADLSMILISFFILMLSATKVDERKAEQVHEALKAAPADPKKDSLQAITKRIETEIKRLNIDKNAQVVYDDAGVAIEFKDGLLFAGGSAAPNPQFSVIVGQVMRVIATTPEQYHLRIEGHTDDTPISTPKFASNWELSAGRGIALMRQFVSKGAKENRISVVSYAHTKPKRPIDGLTGIELAQARAANRRVVIRIEPQ